MSATSDLMPWEAELLGMPDALLACELVEAGERLVDEYVDEDKALDRFYSLTQEAFERWSPDAALAYAEHRIRANETPELIEHAIEDYRLDAERRAARRPEIQERHRAIFG